jgi:serine/threonine protein phosphatase 1
MLHQPANQRVTYAIGDVHGHAAELLKLVGLIRADMAAYPRGTLFRVVLIGDLIDRGPDSRAVIDNVLSLQREADESGGRLEVVPLRGNHEDTVLEIAEGRTSRIERWYPDAHGYGGGASFLRSYGTPDVELADVPVTLRNWVPADHMAFLREKPVYFAAGTYVFAHAGIRPGCELHEQSVFDLMHIRRGFLDYAGDFGGRIVVHGHTPHRVPQIRPNAGTVNRINIDTGCGYGLHLTCVVLEPAWDPGRVRFLSVPNEIECTFVEGYSHGKPASPGLVSAA